MKSANAPSRNAVLPQNAARSPFGRRARNATVPRRYSPGIRSPANARAAIDVDGFGGHTPLFGCVVSQPYRVGRRRDDEFARLLLDHGANATVRASLRKRLRFVEDESTHLYRDVTPFEWGERFHDLDWVSSPVMELLAGRGL